jgi:DNA-binding NarL/FixJ family response regulator
MSRRRPAGGAARHPGAACDVLISDVGLPDGNGWELLKTLGTSGRSTPSR